MQIEKRKNVLIVIDSISGGGAELVAFNLCKYLDRTQFNVSICHLKERGYRGEDLTRQGFDVIGIPQKPSGRKDYLAFRKLRKVLIQKNIDLIHSHCTQALIASAICCLLDKNTKMVHTFHFGNYPFYNKRYMIYERIFCRLTDKLVSVGDEQKRNIQKTYKIPDNRIATIWNGVEDNAQQHERAAPAIWDRVGKNRIIVGTISTFIEQKGLVYLLDVAVAIKKKNPKIAFVLVGDGPLRNDLELECYKLGLEDTVYFFGWLKNAVLDALPFYDIFFQPSLWEAMSMVTLEAMAAGKAIVATNVGENKHILEDGTNAFLVEPRDTKAMIDRIEQLVINLQLRDCFGKSARGKYLELFTVEKMVGRYQKLYLEMLRIN